MKRQLAIATLIILAIASAVGTGYFYREAGTARRESLSERRAGRVRITAYRKKIKALERRVKEDASREIKSASGNTVLTAPLPNQMAKSPLKIAGRAIAFENSVNIRIKDGNGVVLAETHTTAVGSMGEFSDFVVLVDFKKPSQRKGSLEVFQISAKDGSEQDKVSVPLLFD